MTSQAAVQSSLDVLVKGFLYGKDAKPYGIYTVDADSESAKKLSAYDGGATIAVKPTGFVVDISEKNAKKVSIVNENPWITGAIPGVGIFRRMSKINEWIWHPDSLQIAYLSMTRTIGQAHTATAAPVVFLHESPSSLS